MVKVEKLKPLKCWKLVGFKFQHLPKYELFQRNNTICLTYQYDILN